METFAAKILGKSLGIRKTSSVLALLSFSEEMECDVSVKMAELIRTTEHTNKVASDFWTWVLLPEAKQKLLVHYWRIVKQMVSLKREWWLSQMTVFSHNGSMIIGKFLWEMEMLFLITDHTSYLSSWTISQAKLSTHLEQFCFGLHLNFCLSVDLYLRYDI